MKKLLLLFIGISFLLTTNAQTTIIGKVLDISSGQTLIGVNVSIKGTTQGTVTDVEGNYSINTSSQDSILVFSFIGYGLLFNLRNKSIGSKSLLYL